MKTLREHLGVLVGYALLTLLLTYPAVLHLFTHLIGDGGDTNVFVWNLWWIKKALTELHTNPFWTDYIFFPQGVSLVFHDLVPFNGLLGILLHPFVGLVAASNAIVLLSFTLSGYGIYLLIRFLGPDRLSAFIGGIIFAFCPYKFAHLLGHFSLISTEWLPFYALAVLKLTKGTRDGGIGPSLCAAIFLLLIALCSQYYLVYALLFTLLLVCYCAWTVGPRAFWQRGGRRLAAALAFFLVGFAPILFMAGSEMLRERYEPVYAGNARLYQADLLSFVTPSFLHPLLGPLIQPIAGRFKGNLSEGTVFVGYLALILALVAIFKLRSTEPWVRFWSLAFLVFFILSLGPFPRFLGRPIGRKFLFLPYRLIMHIPILDNLRVPSRFDIMVMLCMAVLVAFTCRRLFERYERRGARAFVFLGLTLIITFEYLAIPFPTFRASAPRIYEQIAREAGAFTVLEIPLGRSSGLSKGIGEFRPPSLFYQAVHEKKTFNGFVSRAPTGRLQALGTPPLLRNILDLQGGDLPSGASSNLSARAISDSLAALQVRYVVIHPPFSQSPVRHYVETALPVEKVSEEDGVVAFRVRGPDGPR